MMDTSSARSRIFDRLKKGKPAPVEMPTIPQYGWPGNPCKNFKTQLKSFDGNSMEFDSREQAIEWLTRNLPKDKVVCSALPDFKASSSPADYADPHTATKIDITVAEALLGVGEMGSCFVTDKSLGSPACALLCTDLYLLLDRNKIVEGMHQAYDAVDLNSHAYSAFFTGPSATADIEAVHITGAQAEISLTVLIY